MRALVRALVVPAVLLAAIWASSPALASCVQSNVAERAALAEVVVYGTVTETRQTFAAAGGVIRFRPDRFLKGTLPGEVEVRLGPSNGGAVTSVDYQAATRGEAHTLYLRSAGNGAWQTDACSGSHAGAPTTEESALFGTGTAAPPTAPRDNTPLVLGAVAIAAVAVVVAVFVRRYAGPSTFTTTSP
ncbi:MAG: hypothetical protein M3O80_09435 [Chloroflexota bacterium]|nr:hypothetical protein [Chloroflexota bacterium]